MIKTSILLVLLLTITASCLWAVPQFEAAVSTHEPKLGDSVKLKVEAVWPKSEGDYTFTNSPIQLDNAALLRQGEAQEVFRKNNTDWIRKTLLYEVNPQKNTSVRIGSFSINYVNSVNAQSGIFAVPAFDLHIRPPSQHFMILAAWGAGLLILTCSSLALFYARRKKNRKMDQSAHAPTLEDICIAKLGQITDESILQAPDKTLAILSMLFREYATRYYQIPQKTEMGICEALRKHPHVSPEELKSIQQIGNYFQHMKFAGEKIGAKEIRTLRDNIYAFVYGKNIAS